MATNIETRKKDSPLIQIQVKKPTANGGGTNGKSVTATLSIDVKALINELTSNLEGEVRFDDGSRALYATDASNYRQVPIGVVLPKTVDDVVKTVAACRKFGAPLLSRGGGTSLAGQTCNVAVVMDFSKYLDKVLTIDVENKIGTVEPGCVLDTLRKEGEKHGITFGPDPSTHNRNTLGGMIGNDSCGTHSIMAALYGNGPKTADNVEEMDVLLYDGTRMRVGKTSDAELAQIIADGGRRGEIYQKLKDLRDKYGDLIRERFVNIPRRVSGFNLQYLLPENGFNVARALVGTESTCVTVLEAKMNMIPNPKSRTLVILGYKDIFCAGDNVPEIMKHEPIACEGLDDVLIELMKQKNLQPREVELLPKGGGWLLVEFGGASDDEVNDQAKKFMAAMEKSPNAPTMKHIEEKDEQKQFWKVRESGLGATAFGMDGEITFPGWEDSAVPIDKIGAYMRELRKLFEKYDYQVSIYGHLGQGCVHCSIPFDLMTHEGVENFKSFMHEAVDLVLKYGGSLSGEHGDGQSRAQFLPKMYGEELVQAFREFKTIFDPDWKMNPGKAIDAYKIDENLRLGADYNPWQTETHFQFPKDDGNFANAALRCVGAGICRRNDHVGVMCPSYRATGDEAHSTRGRARMLFEMMQAKEIGKNQWKDEAVKDALDLCMACKGCKGECPVQVDMASYKAEFLAHYYEGKIRPRSAFAFGFINKWAKIAAIAPFLPNFFTSTPVLKNIAKFAAGVAPERDVPQFAPQTFRSWLLKREVKLNNKRKNYITASANKNRPQVILWADTFNNNFHTTTAQAAVEVLEAAGFQVLVPRQNLCCGRPLYDYGFMNEAKKYLRRIIETMREEIEAGIPMVALEPSCASVFRDELVNLFPKDENAKRLCAQTFVLSEFLVKYAKDFELPKLNKKAVVHGHCHHKSIMKMTDEEKILKEMNVECEAPEEGCCGMAGAFGFEKGEHYEVAIKCGEHKLLPAVRSADDETLIIADGFSCREQITQKTDREPLHLAQIIQMGLQGDAQITIPLPVAETTKIPSRIMTSMLARIALNIGAKFRAMTGMMRG